MKKINFFLLYIVFCICCQPASAFRVKGKYLVEGDLDGPPSVCKFIVDTKGSLCSGTLISPQYIATAAHCVLETNKEGNVIEGKMPTGGMKVYCGYHYNKAKEFYEEFNVLKIKYPQEILNTRGGGG